ncbi:hypothetical protein [Tenacibaculum maritimum]|uniref:hypothetical protein n=1 Tax=Tenacibaculum maritimum TaxID=107401 RepID=UPI0012E5CBCD|nr:hypothetical protein [Tenacibaculum maritimum]MCD9585876.1 hypothetical protein [Tenacibaculum maritimum]MCD9612101.1 hypothetical protein [Tenacibaculum maritimum]MCD9622000.1 hypothetical protein [Tenacibaculum maritimum]MCD9628527.1 hypothetical protein [Tenacibaculum maritimum]MCD9631458.1 hypothetical protein [Tenacibaculum maritimum]
MPDLNIKKFLDSNTFFIDESHQIIEDFIINNSDTSFGEDIIMYYFNYKGYDITFVYNKPKKSLISEQIEIKNGDEIKNIMLEKCLNLKSYMKELDSNIDSIYFDDMGEEVVFMKNGINAHFNDGQLCKITSKSDISRNLIKQIMKKRE